MIKISPLRLAALSLLLLTALPAWAQADLLWARPAGGSSLDDRGYGAAARPDGAVLIAGYFTNTADFDGDGIPDISAPGGSSDTDAFLAAYAGPDGALLWVRSIGAVGAHTGDLDSAAEVTSDAAGNAYVVGSHGGTADFDGDGVPDVTGEYEASSFLASYDPNGTFRWVREVHNTAQDFATGVALDANGNIFITGLFNDDVDFDGDGTPELVHDGSAALYVAAYDAAGTFQWARGATSTGFDEVQGRGAATDAAGNVYVTGEFRGSADFDGDGTPDAVSAGGLDSFVASYASDGTFRWALPVGGTSTDIGHGIAVGSGATVFATGYFTGAADFDADGTTDLTSRGSADIFLAAYGTDGTLQWARNYGGTDFDRGFDVETDGDGRPYLAGAFRGAGDFDGDGTTDATAQLTDPVLLALDADGTVLGIETPTGPFTEEARGVAVSAGGQASITGTFDQSLDFDGDGTPDVTTSGNIDLFVASYGAEPAPLAVAAQPVGGPITIPAGGGSFQFMVTLTNTTDQPQSFQAWSEVAGPVNRSPIIGPRTVTLRPGASVTRTLVQQVPGAAPAGSYTYTVNVGTFGGAVSASASFLVEKQGSAARGGASSGTWSVRGWDGAEASQSVALPEGFALSAVYPNPFSRRAELTLEVAEAQAVTVAVFDALGRRVAVVHSGMLAAGENHTLVVDAVGVPSGIYVVRASGETFAATRRVTVLH